MFNCLINVLVSYYRYLDCEWWLAVCWTSVETAAQAERSWSWHGVSASVFSRYSGTSSPETGTSWQELQVSPIYTEGREDQSLTMTHALQDHIFRQKKV